jgi:hypothetical protein
VADRWRTGGHRTDEPGPRQRTIYDLASGELIGCMFTTEDARLAVAAVNEHVALRAELLRLLSLYDNDGTLVIEAGEGADAACWHLALAADYPAIAAALRAAHDRADAGLG